MALPITVSKILTAEECVVLPLTKKCQRCKQALSIEAFGKNSRRIDGLQHYCRGCFSEYRKNDRKSERDAAEESSRQNGKVCTSCNLTKSISEFGKNVSAQDRHNYRCKECVNENLKNRKPKTKTMTQRRIGWLWTKYRIRYDDYMNILDKQSYQCAICKYPHKDDEPLVVDHCHDSEKVRGLLCGKCNTGIGFLRDNATLCRIAAEYLEERG